MKTKIEWATDVWNPTWGCSKVSEGCRNCYAIRQAHVHGKGERAGLTKIVNGAPNWTGEVRLIESMLTLPLRQRRPRTYFVNSMSDLFHEALSRQDILRVLAVAAFVDVHDYLILTKRSARMREIMSDPNLPAELENMALRLGVETGDRTEQEIEAFRGGMPWPLPSVWPGVSCEDRASLHRVNDLRATPAAVRFLSLEPLLEDLGTLDLKGIDWVIVGGESGPGARPCDLAWIRSIRDQSKAAGVACFVKQLGAKPFEERKAEGGVHGTAEALANIGSRHPQQPWFQNDKDFWTLVHTPDGQSNWFKSYRLRDRKGGDWNEWPEDLRVREFPEVCP